MKSCGRKSASTHSQYSRLPEGGASVGFVSQFQRSEFDRRLHRDVDPQLGGDSVLGVLENGVTKAVTGDIRVWPTAGVRVGDQNCPVSSSRM